MKSEMAGWYCPRMEKTGEDGEPMKKVYFVMQVASMANSQCKKG